MSTVSIDASGEDARRLVIGRIYTDTQERAAFRLVAIDYRPSGRATLWFEQVPHCPSGKHDDTLSLPA